MDQTCIDNFLVQCSPRHVESHSDSSDFESTYNVPFKDNLKLPVAVPKDGNQSLFRNKSCRKRRRHEVVTGRYRNNFQLYSVNTQCDRDIPVKGMQMCPRRQVLCDKYVDCTTFNEIGNLKVSNNDHRSGDQTSNFKDKSTSRLSVRNKIVPCLSTIFKHPTKCTRSIRENHYCDTACSACFEHPRTKKFSKSRGGYSVQPVYAVAKEIARFPFQRPNDYVELSRVDALKRNNSSEYVHEYSLSSSSEQEIKPYKYKKLVKYIMRKLEKRIYREYTNGVTINHQKQQYPSKLQLKLPCQIFTTSSCQTKSDYTISESHMPSNSSEFWDFLFKKIKYQIYKAEESKYTTATCCDKDSCFFQYPSNSNISTNKPKPQPKGSKQFQKKEGPFECCQKLGQSLSEILTKMKTENSEVICKCPKLNKSSSPDNVKSQEKLKPYQVQHDALKKTLADQYNAEILCIHSPPCVLINGCLNLPQPITSTPQGTLFYPMTQSKKSSFAQMCKKMKRSKPKRRDQAIQYHPSSIDLQEYLPEFRTEKIVQSVCNHNPPCEVVRGCHKSRYNPTLQTSCVHVPMCPKLPECILEKGNLEEKTCNHRPKCIELPLCTRKYITLTAKENATTQVKPKTKIGCRHQPPCLMIPKCIAQVIEGDLYPGNAIPGCVHQPSCEMIPACIRKQFKESVSVQSQYPSASCPIV